MLNPSSRNIQNEKTLYNSQIASIIMVCMIVYKASSLPGLVSDSLKSSTLWLYMFMTIIEIVIFVAIYIFMQNNGHEFLVEQKSKAYKCALFVLFIYLIAKGLFYFSYITVYLTLELFAGGISFLIVIAYLVPVFYIGIKGIRCIARLSELLVILTFLIFLLTFAFLDTKLTFSNNFPVLSVPPKEFFSEGLIFGLWLGDTIPFLLLKVKNKKLPYIGMSTTATIIFIILIPLFGVAMYGDSLSFVSNMLTYLASFSQLSFEIGRMEWTALFAMIVLSMISLSLIFWSASECCETLFKSKKPMHIAFPIACLCILFFAPSVRAICDIALTDVGYAFTALGLFIPFSFLFILVVVKRKHNEKIFIRPPEHNKKDFLDLPPDAKGDDEIERELQKNSPENKPNAPISNPAFKDNLTSFKDNITSFKEKIEALEDSFSPANSLAISANNEIAATKDSMQNIEANDSTSKETILSNVDFPSSSNKSCNDNKDSNNTDNQSTEPNKIIDEENESKIVSSRSARHIDFL